MSMKVTFDNLPIWMALANAVIFPLVTVFIGDRSWGYTLALVPIAGVGSYVGCRLGQWAFGRFRRG